MLTPKRLFAKKSVGDEASGPTRERVYMFVCEQILKGHFEGGSFIEEEHISSAINVSRTPVREAFHRLEAEKFIDLCRDAAHSSVKSLLPNLLTSMNLAGS